MSSSTFVAEYSPEEIKKAHEVLYNEGLRMRIQVAGKEYVEKSLAAATDPFSKPMQEVSLYHHRPCVPLADNPSSSSPKHAGVGYGPDQASS